MIISPKRRFAFVHIPKTGGTSFALAYEDRAAADDILIGDTPKAKCRKNRLAHVDVQGRKWKHSTLRDMAPLVPADYFVATLVRNPWDRMVSYYHWLREQRFEHPAVTIAQSVDFIGFLRDPVIQNSVRSHPYSSYVAGADQVDRCSAYVRLEQPEDFDAVWQYLGFELTIPHINRSDRNLDWRHYYDSEAYDIVGKLSAVDIAKFGYQSQL